MARKYDFISELYNRTCKTVVASPASWEAFLRSACYNYRLRFDEQLLVHAQRPDATAVLQIDDWNQKFGRWVNRGAHGIAVFEDADQRRQRLVHYRNMGRIIMDENRLPELPQEAFRPMIAQSVQLEQFLGEELTFCFRDLDGAHTFTTCYGDIYKTVNALRDYVRLLESVCDQWELTGFHRATYEYHAEKLRKIADKLQAGIGYDYDKAVEKCKKKRARKSHSNDVGEDALLLTVRAAGKSADNEKEAAPYEEDTPWEPELE